MWAMVLVNIPDAGTRWFGSEHEANSAGFQTGFKYKAFYVDDIPNYIAWKCRSVEVMYNNNTLS